MTTEAGSHHHYVQDCLNEMSGEIIHVDSDVTHVVVSNYICGSGRARRRRELRRCNIFHAARLLEKLGMTLSCKHHKSISFDSSLCF